MFEQVCGIPVREIQPGRWAADTCPRHPGEGERGVEMTRDRWRCRDGCRPGDFSLIHLVGVHAGFVDRPQADYRSLMWLVHWLKENRPDVLDGLDL